MKILSDAPKNVKDREEYAWYKAHHICVKCRHEVAAKGRSRCLNCLEKHQKYNLDRKPLSTEQYYAVLMHKKRRRDLLTAFGVCVECNKRDAVPGHVLCLECRLKAKKSVEKANRKKGIYPRNDYSDMCVKCGKNPPIAGKKLCAACYEQAVKALEKARAAVDYRKHFWRDDNRAAFGRYETGVRE